MAESGHCGHIEPVPCKTRNDHTIYKWTQPSLDKALQGRILTFTCLRGGDLPHVKRATKTESYMNRTLRRIFRRDVFAGT